MTRFGLLAGAAIVTGIAGARTAPSPRIAPLADPLVARVVGQSLSTERLAALVASAPIPPSRQNVALAADLWINYHLLAYANARGDELDNDTRLVDAAMWKDILTKRVVRFYEVVRRSFPPIDTSGLAARYERGRYLAAQHILFLMPQGGMGMSQQKQDSIRNRAQDVLRRVTSANFNALAKQYTEEPGGKEKFGSLGLFPVAPSDSAMLPDFEAAVKALRPGQITPALVQTIYGYHIIRRYTLAEVRSEFLARLASDAEPAGTAQYLARLRAQYQLAFARGAADKIRAIAKAPVASAKQDRTTIATTTMGPFTAARLAQWMEELPKHQPLAQRLVDAPDSTALRLVTELIEQEMLASEAQKAGINPDTAELRVIRQGIATMRSIAGKPLRVDPASLRSAGATVAARQQVGASRIEAALDMIFSSGGRDFAEVQVPLANLLRSKYSYRLNGAQLQRATERAVAMRIALDSLAPRKKG